MNIITRQHPQRDPLLESHKGSVRPVRLLLVEDSKVLTERLSEVIRQIPEIELIAAVDTEDGARAAVTREHVDLMILDLHLRQGNGFGVLRALSQLPERPLIVVLTNYDLPQYKDAALALGAAHFMDKIRDYDSLPEVLQQLAVQARESSGGSV